MNKMLKAMLLNVALCGSGTPAFACINDFDTLREERQFKALYPDATPEAPQSTPAEPTIDVNRLLAVGGPFMGVALLCGACVVNFTRRS